MTEDPVVGPRSQRPSATAVLPRAPAPSAAVHWCPQCGAPLADAQRLCVRCGQDLVRRYRRAPSWQAMLTIGVMAVLGLGVGAGLAVAALTNDDSSGGKPAKAVTKPAARPAPGAPASPTPGRPVTPTSAPPLKPPSDLKPTAPPTQPNAPAKPNAAPAQPQPKAAPAKPQPGAQAPPKPAD
jgi:hypothetical protein